MRHLERATRNNQPGQDLSDLDHVLDTLLAGGSLPDADESGLQPVADLLTALRQPAAPAELTGQASALAEFRARPRPTSAVTWGRRRGSPARGRWLRPRPATALAAGVVVVAGLAAGAYEGDLPAPVQRLWHNTIGLTAIQSKRPPRPAHPGQTSTTSPSPHGTHGPGQHAAAQPGQQPGDSHPAARRDGQRGGDQPSQQNSSSPSHPRSSPSPSPPATPEPSTSPAAQPSPQSSSSTGPHHPDSSSSSSP